MTHETGLTLKDTTHQDHLGRMTTEIKYARLVGAWQSAPPDLPDEAYDEQIIEIAHQDRRTMTATICFTFDEMDKLTQWWLDGKE